MNEHRVREILEGGGGVAGRALRALLHIPGKLYGGAMLLRRELYRQGVFASAAASVPVISVGNVTAGGSGKTPLVALLANHFLAKGKLPAILLRGYRSGGAAAGSDEAILYRKLCPSALVEVGADRAASAKRAAEAGADVILMDDGFQHLRLKRDLDIVLVDATSPWGGGRAIPGGLLREPLSALADAGVILVTRSDQASGDDLDGIAVRAGRFAPRAVLFTARHKPVRLRSAENAAIPIERLRGKRVVVLSGIARPEAFAKTLSSLGADIVDSFIGNDHRHFPPEFVERAAARAKELDAVVVATEKDEAKNLSSSDALWVLGVEQEIAGAETLFRIVDDAAGVK